MAGRPQVCVWGGIKGAGRTHLGPAGTEDPGGRDDHRSMDPQGARLLDLLQHEAGYLAVVLEGGTQLSWAKLSPGPQPSTARGGLREQGEHTHCLLAPGATDGHNLLAVEGELLLEALGWTGGWGARGQAWSSRSRPPSVVNLSPPREIEHIF